MEESCSDFLYKLKETKKSLGENQAPKQSDECEITEPRKKKPKLIKQKKRYTTGINHMVG
jgi:hypothetical protein